MYISASRREQTPEFDYQLMADDILEFIEQQQITKAHIIGHSMGGKAAMKFALEYPDKVEKLIVVDVAPVAYDDNHSSIFKSLFAADVKHASSREEVEKTLRANLQDDLTTVHFLMKGLQRAGTGQEGFQWKFNLEALYANYGEISAAIEASKPFEGETFFIKGEKSSYLDEANYSAASKLFPHNQLREIKGAGHWVHAEKPEEFLEEISRFLA